MACNQISELPPFKKVVERLPPGGQAFIPIRPIPIVIVVALPGHTFDSTKIRDFISNGKRGVNYRAGVWHMPQISAHLNQQYLIVDRACRSQSCVLHGDLASEAFLSEFVGVMPLKAACQYEYRIDL